MYNFRAATDHFLRRCSYTYSAVFEQNIVSAKRPPFMRYHGVSLLQHFISKSFFSFSQF